MGYPIAEILVVVLHVDLCSDHVNERQPHSVCGKMTLECTAAQGGDHNDCENTTLHIGGI